jgi:triosephosphate isomerase
MLIKKILIFNWKANPTSLGEASNLANILNQTFPTLSTHYELAVAVPSLYLMPLSQIINKGIRLMAQTIGVPDVGPHTGALAPIMLKENSLSYSLLGHSEDRRQNKLVNSDISFLLKANLKNGVKTVLCIGEETKNESSFKELQEQIDQIFFPAVGGYSPLEIYNSIALAYEPLWAVGSEIEIDLNYIEKQISSLRDYLKSKAQDRLDILYGGSVNKTNIKQLLSLSVLSGVLIGEKSSQKDWLEDFLKSMV